MTEQAWKIFCNFKTEYKSQIEKWMEKAENLPELQKSAANFYKTPDYPIETPIVYNRALDEISPEDEIRLIVIGDNPGKDEQLAKNNKYLVGQAGKIAEGYFKKNPELQIDFRKNVIILNKTPIHSAKTNHLKKIASEGGQKIAELIEETQIWMAKETAKLHINLCTSCNSSPFPELWLVGYSELKEKCIFEKYRDELKNFYKSNNQNYWNQVYTFQHFSMNRFTIDLNNFRENSENSNLTLLESIHTLGTIHRHEIFGEI